MRVPMSEPDVTDAEIRAVTDVLRTPVLALGPRAEAWSAPSPRAHACPTASRSRAAPRGCTSA